MDFIMSYIIILILNNHVLILKLKITNKLNLNQYLIKSIANQDFEGKI
jgi:hypothetical protein